VPDESRWHRHILGKGAIVTSQWIVAEDSSHYFVANLHALHVVLNAKLVGFHLVPKRNNHA
jgi:hypothetical protein